MKRPAQLRESTMKITVIKKAVTTGKQAMGCPVFVDDNGVTKK